jgi:hypothetical protein
MAMPDRTIQQDPQTAKAQQTGQMGNGHEQAIEKHFKIRQVTNVQASWTERARGQPGAFTLQLILDNGVEEYILRPDAQDVEVLLRLFSSSHATMFDMERKVLIFGNAPAK